MWRQNDRSGLTGHTYEGGRDNCLLRIILTRATKDSSIPVEQDCDQSNK